MHLDTHRADRCIALLLQNLDATLEGLLHVVKHAFEVIGGLDHGAVHVLDVLHRLAGVQDGDGGSIVDVHHKRFPFVRVAHLRLIDQLGGGVRLSLSAAHGSSLDVMFSSDRNMLFSSTTLAVAAATAAVTSTQLLAPLPLVLLLLVLLLLLLL